jgi:hypothetical protein
MTHKHLQLGLAVRFFTLCAVMEITALALVPFSLTAQTPATEIFQRDPNRASALRNHLPGLARRDDALPSGSRRVEPPYTVVAYATSQK